MSAPKLVVVGTTPVLALAYNENRTSLRIYYHPSAAVPTNLSVVYVGLGIPPDPTGGNPLAFDPLTPGAELRLSESFPGDPAVSREPVWLVSAGAGQVVQIEQDTFLPDEPERSVPVFITGQGPGPGARAAPRPVPTPSDFLPIETELPTQGPIPAEIGVGAALIAPPGGPGPTVSPPVPPPPTPTGAPGSPGPYAQKV